MPFGIYHQSPSSELNTSLPKADTLFELEENSLERTLLTCPAALKDQSERILAMLADTGSSLDDGQAVEKAVALLANAHASSVVSGNRERVDRQVDEAHETTHTVSVPSAALVAQTRRLKARIAAASGNFELARALFEGIEAERDPQESNRRHPASYRDALELALLRLCTTASEREALREFPDKEYRLLCAEIARQLDVARASVRGSELSLAKDLL